MKPNEFILNSDYLTLANVENRTFSATVPSITMPSNQLYTATFTFTCKNSPQTFTRAYIHHSMWEDNLWGVGRSGETSYKNGEDIFYERMHVTTPTDSTVKLQLEVQGPSGATMPAHEVSIKVFRFKVPNAL